MKATRWKGRLALTGLVLLLGCSERGMDAGLPLQPKHETEQVLFSWQYGNGYTVVRESEESVGSVQAVIGEAGGSLSLGKHTLLVPAGAVYGNVTFRMTKSDGDHVRLHLTAGRFDTNDVGRFGFFKPVKLMLSYEGAANLPTEATPAVAMLYVRPDETVEALPSSVNVDDQWVSAELRHFSEYAVAWP